MVTSAIANDHAMNPVTKTAMAHFVLSMYTNGKIDAAVDAVTNKGTVTMTLHTLVSEPMLIDF